MKKVRILDTWKPLMLMGLLVASIVLCSACSRKKEPEENKQVEQTDNQEKEKAEKVEEKELDLESTVISIGKETVLHREILTYMYLLKSNYEPELGTGIWDYTIEGETIERKALEETIHMVTEIKIIKRKAQEASVFLTADELDGIKVKAENYLAKAAWEDVQKFGLTVDMLSAVFSDNEIAEKMFDLCINQVNTAITDEEAKQIKVQYLLLMTNGMNKNQITIKMNQSNRLKTLSRANRLLKQAKKTESFYSFADANTDAMVVEQTIGRDTMSAEFTNAAFSLKTGKFSKVVEAPEGFYIIYCVNEYDEDATGREKERIILEEQTKIFESRYKEWASQYQVRISSLIWNQNYFGDK